MAKTDKEPKKEKTFDTNRKNQKHLAKNFDKALAAARKELSVEQATIVEQYLVMAAQGSETNWKPKPVEVEGEPTLVPTEPAVEGPTTED